MSENRLPGRKPDYLIFLLVAGLSLFGLIMVFSASYYTHAVRSGSSGLTVLIKQGWMVTLGFIFMLVTMFVPYRFYNRFRFKGLSLISSLAVAATVALLIVVLLMPGDTNGAKRWINILGVSVQPSELARFAMILFVSDQFARKRADLVQRQDLGRFFRAFAPSLCVAGGICLLILAGRNLSMTAATGLTFICLCIAAGIQWRVIVSLCIAAVAAGVIATVIEPYRIARVMIFTDPFSDPQGNGYQLVQSLYALGAGGLTGVGIGNSTQKYLYLTYGDSDFIFAIIGEETGFLGIVLLLAVYGLLIYRGLRTASRAESSEGMLMATGMISTIAIQLIINVAVCTSSMPPTGLPLPFISAGGTSMIIFMIEMGILLNISRFSRQT